jgi:DNA-binding transcriptional ArsR family regulator
MTKLSAIDAANATFKALSDPTRRQILALLAGKEKTIAEVADNFDMTRAGVKKHLSLLQAGDLITVRAQGRERFNSLNPEGFRAAGSWLESFDQYWTTKLDALKAAAEQEHSNG